MSRYAAASRVILLLSDTSLTMTLTAVAPSLEFKNSFLAMLDDFETYDPSNAEFYASAKSDFAAYIRSLLDEEQGLNLREGWVPCTHTWLVASGGMVVGVTRLRHNISTQFLFQNGGHVGYDIAPSYRGKGYGHFALRTALSHARHHGLHRVLLVTSKDNVRSRAVIERQEGELESIVFRSFGVSSCAGIGSMCRNRAKFFYEAGYTYGCAPSYSSSP
jgi:predicted acetyltransferase